MIPAAIVGTGKIFSKGELFPKLKLIYGKPIAFKGNRKDKQALADFSQKIMDEIAVMKKSAEE